MAKRLRLKRIFSIAAVAPLLVTLSSCTNEVKLAQSKDTLAQKTLTQSGQPVVYPSDTPSVPDGKVVWQEQNCAQCHGATGSGGSAPVDLTNKDWMREQKPVDQYVFLTYGKEGSNHPALASKLESRQIWNLVFYSRSLASPPLSDEESMKISAVFGANCVVCHGNKGNGDGPLAHSLEPVPANFELKPRFYDRTDAVLWDHIANGIKWEGMPNFLNKEDKAKSVKFDKEYIWKLVQYVRHFHESNIATVATNPSPTETQKEGDHGSSEKSQAVQ